ncbi:MAG: hypothetical protein V7750_19605 [Sneathiella sp.]
MYERIITGLMLVVATIHILPIIGFVGIDRLAALYEIKINDGNLEILMRHRAVLFGILGGFLAYAAFTPSNQPLAFLAAGISLLSFLFLTFSVGEFNDAIQKVVIVDIVALVCLFGAIVLYFLKKYG